MQILALDGNSEQLFGFVIALNHRGYSVDLVNDTAEACSRIRETRYDLLIVTSVLPSGVPNPISIITDDRRRGVAFLTYLGWQDPPPVTHAILIDTCPSYFPEDLRHQSQRTGLVEVTVLEASVETQTLLDEVHRIRIAQEIPMSRFANHRSPRP